MGSRRPTAARAFEYSASETKSLIEPFVTESLGVLGLIPAGIGSGHRCPDGAGDFMSVLVTVRDPIDWSCDGKIDPPRTTEGFDVNGDGVENTLAGSDSDWKRIWFKSGGIGGGTNSGAAGVPVSGSTPAVPELTAEQDAVIAPIDTAAPTTTLRETPASNAAGWHRGNVTLTLTGPAARATA